MKKLTTISTVALFGAALVSGVVAWQGRSLPEAPPQIPAQPAAVPIVVIEAYPFTLGEPAVHNYRSERPGFDRGTLLVIQTDPQMLIRRQTAEAVLYVGAETAVRVNNGDESGYLVAYVPGEVDLSTVPVFFGEPALPEQVTAAEAARQLDLAFAAGAPVTPAARVTEVTREPVSFADEHELLLSASYLVEQYAPAEEDLIAGLRAPLIR